MNDFLIYTLPIWAIIAIIVFTVLTVLCMVNIIWNKNQTKLLKSLMKDYQN